MEILIVDNSKIYSQILESNFDPDSNTIHYFKSPNDALESVSNNNYDYICVSYALENMDGITFASELRLLSNYAHVPIILFASKKDNDIVERAFK